MVLPARFSQTTPNWYDQPMPTDPAEVARWVASQNGTTPMFQPSQSIPGPNGESGWTMAGQDNPALKDLTPGEYYAQLLNNRAVQAGLDPRSPDAKMFQLAMTSRAQVRPEEMQAAYNAAGSGLGGPHPILNDAMLNFLEQNFGYSPTTGTTDKTGAGGGSPAAPVRGMPGNDYPGSGPGIGGGGGGNQFAPPTVGPVQVPGGPRDGSSYQGLPHALDPNLYPPGMLESWLQNQDNQRQKQQRPMGDPSLVFGGY